VISDPPMCGIESKIRLSLLCLGRIIGDQARFS
jgi:hypothetical protein